MHSFLQVIVKRLVSTIRLQSWGLIGCIHNEIYGNSTTVALTGPTSLRCFILHRAQSQSTKMDKKLSVSPSLNVTNLTYGGFKFTSIVFLNFLLLGHSQRSHAGDSTFATAHVNHRFIKKHFQTLSLLTLFQRLDR